MDLILQLIGATGSTGVLVWFMYHTQTKVLPDKDKLFAEQLKYKSDLFAKTISDTVERHERHVIDIIAQFRQDLANEREFRKIENESIKVAIRDSVERVVSEVLKLTTRTNKTLLKHSENSRRLNCLLYFAKNLLRPLA